VGLGFIVFGGAYPLNTNGKIHCCIAGQCVPTHARRYHISGHPTAGCHRAISRLLVGPTEKPPALPFCGLYGPDGAQLTIVTGELVSDETATTVVECVKGGTRCPSLAQRVSAPLKQEDASAPKETAFGTGRVLVTIDFCSYQARHFIRPHLDPPGRIRYRCESQTVTIRQAGGYASSPVDKAHSR
jgi:hypothetical protein